MTLGIEAIPAFADNYIWALSNQGRCVLVDPGDAAGPLDYLRRHELELTGILLTHHHHDHVGGVAAIRRRHPAPAWGPRDPRMPADVTPVAAGERVSIEAPALDFEVLETPGHTSTHIAFYGHGMLFCGDTLFSSGCGRLFEGSPEQMQASLDRLAALPDDTAVYCAHEYTEANCRFAMQVEPDNASLRARAAEVRAQRARGGITLPSRLDGEKRFNPFLRTREPAVIDAAQQREPGTPDRPEAVFGVIRRWKDAC